MNRYKSDKYDGALRGRTQKAAGEAFGYQVWTSRLPSENVVTMKMKLGFRTFIDFDFHMSWDLQIVGRILNEVFRQVTIQNQMDVREVKAVKRTRWAESPATYTQRLCAGHDLRSY